VKIREETLSVSGLRHNAFIYDSDEEFVGRMATFLEDGLEEGASTVAVTTRSNCALLRDALGAASDHVAFVDRDAWYVRPATTIATYHARLREFERAGARSIRVVAELQFGPKPEEWNEWMAYEAISNRALAEHPAWIVCAYDARVLPEQVIEGAWRTHPEVLTEGSQVSPLFDEPEHVVRGLAPEHEPLSELRTVPSGDDPVTFRERLAAEMAAANVPPTKALNLLLAANEIVRNAFQHAGGPATLRVGLVEGCFVCEISDRGPGFDDPMAGYLPPKPEHGRGTGLWSARQLTSRLELIPSADGLTVRLWL
jgi:anti-sigma regulatory factor (Ser/Thr protein kinase)